MNKFKFISKKELVQEIQWPTKVSLAFNPENVSEEFKDKLFLIIWCCISYQHIRHIRNQYFNQEIKEFVNSLKENKPDTHQDFKKILTISSLRDYGTKHIFEVSDVFWMQVWRYLRKELLKDRFQMSLFDEDYLEIEVKIKLWTHSCMKNFIEQKNF